MRRRRWHLRLSAILLAGACAAPPAGQAPVGGDSIAPAADTPPLPGEDAALATDSAAYRLRRTPDALEAAIITTFTNRTADTVWLHPCGRPEAGPAFGLEKWVGGTWRRSYSRICPLILLLDVPALAPGASKLDTAQVRGWLRPHTVPRFELEPVEGWYRLVYSSAFARREPDGRLIDLLPKAERVSIPFRLLVE